MTAVVFFIEQIALGLYILIGLGIFLTMRRWFMVRGDLRATQFELEREIFRYRQANARTMFILLIEAALLVFGIQVVVAPTIRQTGGATLDVQEVIQDLPYATPTLGQVVFGNSPIDASGVQLQQQDTSNQIQSTAVPTATPVGTLIANPPPIAGCDTPGATLQVPANGMLVFEPINVVGTANAENFAFYRFEIKGLSTFGNFAPLRDYDRPVPAVGELGQFVPSFYDPGDYQFRLTVFDITNTLRAACTVNITISPPIPTATPIRSP
jgi:hypothetical protein